MNDSLFEQISRQGTSVFAHNLAVAGIKLS